MTLDLFHSKTHEINTLKPTAEGFVHAISTGKDPYFIIQPLDFTREYLQVSMKVENIKASDFDYLHAKLYFLEEGMSHFQESHSLTEAIQGIDRYCTYRFKCLPFQTGRIVGLRFDPINCPAELTIKKIELRRYRAEQGDSDEAKVKDFNLLLLSYYSRSGSTLLMKMLTRHPGITGYAKGTHDPHMIKYFARFYYMIRNSHMYTNDHSHGPMLERLERLADHYSDESILPKPLGFSQDMDIELFEEHYSRFLAGYIPHLIDNMDTPHVSTAKYYIEKHMDGRSFELLKTILALFPSCKVLMLFRDPRDVYISYNAFSTRESIIEMKGSREAKIDQIMYHYAKRLELRAAYKSITHTVRYEDIILNPIQSIRKILHFLNLETDDNVIENLLKPLEGTDFQAQRHITAGTPMDSIGRWKTEMPESDKAYFERYSGIMEKLSYSYD